MKDSDKKEVSLNWKSIGSVELKALNEEIRTNSLVLNEFGSYIAFCVIDREFETQRMDQNFVKLFKCSQILIEFLLNEFNRFKSCENEKKSHINLIRENKKLRKLLEIQQKAMTYSRTFNGDNLQCPHCPKVFFDSIFLKTHITRRHPKESLDSEGMLSLTNKINDYQKVLIGDNQNLDKLKDEIQDLTQKLAKTQTDLMSERDERIKLEDRIVYVMKVRDKEIQQTLKEELEEFKFIQRERDIENVIQINDKNVEKDFRNNCFDEQNPNPLGIHKIEEMIAIQAKEMTKLGNNVQKLVTHLTDSSDENFKFKQTSKTNIKSEESNRDNYEKVLNLMKPNKSHLNSVENFGLKEFENMSQEKHKTIHYHNRESVKLSDVLNDVERSLDEKLISFGIDINSDGITDEQYSNAIKKLNVERNLLIQQNRFDYDFCAVEQQIRQFVDKKVDQRIGEPKQESQLLTVPKIRINDFQSEKKNHLETQKHSVEAIVHSSPLNEPKISDKNIIEDMDSNSETIEKSVIQEISLKSVLKPIISESKTSENSEIKAKQRRIHFSEHRIEHQISPEESSEETSEEYGPVVADSGSYVSFGSNKSLEAPIPAQRTRKTNLTLDLKSNNETNDDSSEEINYEIDDELMDEILQTNSFVKNEDSNERKNVRNQNNSRQTKVQELTEMIEQQLNKRSVSNKRPPIGSVNVMSEYKSKTNGSSVHRIDYDSDSD